MLEGPILLNYDTIYGINKNLNHDIEDYILSDLGDSQLDVCSLLRLTDNRNESCCKIVDDIGQSDIDGGIQCLFCK